MAAGQRHRARVAVLQALYEADNSRHRPEDVLERIIAEERLPKAAAGFAQALIQGVLSQQDEIDRVIAQAAPAWPVEQLPPVDRNILRLAIRELLGDNGTPVRAVINEAVELAKRFGNESSARFVNGVLGTIERQRHELRIDQPATGRG